MPFAKDRSMTKLANDLSSSSIASVSLEDAHEAIDRRIKLFRTLQGVFSIDGSEPPLSIVTRLIINPNSLCSAQLMEKYYDLAHALDPIIRHIDTTETKVIIETLTSVLSNVYHLQAKSTVSKSLSLRSLLSKNDNNEIKSDSKIDWQWTYGMVDSWSWNNANESNQSISKLVPFPLCGPVSASCLFEIFLIIYKRLKLRLTDNTLKSFGILDDLVRNYVLTEITQQIENTAAKELEKELQTLQESLAVI